jgi:hypothetical protein
MERMPDRGELSTETAGSLSRREFASRVGVGSVAAFGMALAAPKISTIRVAMHTAQVGSPTNPSTTTTTTGGNPTPQGRLRLSVSAACVGDTVEVTAEGFSPNTAVTLQVDSGANVLGVLTADGKGEVHTSFQLNDNMPKGPRKIRCVGIAPGGRTLMVDAPINIKDQGDCDVGPEGTTTTLPPTSVSGTTATTSPTTVPTPTSVVSSRGAGGGGGKPNQGSGLLAFTGTDAMDLAVLGVAAAIGGRALYALARNADGEDEDE